MMFRLSADSTKYKLKQLGDCVEVLDRQRIPLNAEARRQRKGNIPYYGANGQLDTVDDWIFNEDLVLVAEDGGFFYDPIRPISYRVSGKTWVNNHAHVLRPLGKIDVDWLNYSICMQDIRHLIKGATLKKLNQRDLKKVEIPLPPLPEQQRIVARIKECMDRVDEIEQLRTKCLQEREALLPSLIDEAMSAVDGEPVILKDICKITSRLTDPRTEENKNKLHVGGANIEAQTGNLLNLKTAAEEKLKSNKFPFDSTMVLYNKIRPYLMKVARPSFDGLCSADMYPLFPDEKRISRNFLFYLLLSRHFTDYAISGSNRAGMPKVNRNHLFAYSFTLPDRTLQDEICEKLDEAYFAINALRSELEYNQTETGLLRESILRKAFAGEL